MEKLGPLFPSLMCLYSSLQPARLFFPNQPYGFVPSDSYRLHGIEAIGLLFQYLVCFRQEGYLEKFRVLFLVV